MMDEIKGGFLTDLWNAMNNLHVWRGKLSMLKQFSKQEIVDVSVTFHLTNGRSARIGIADLELNPKSTSDTDYERVKQILRGKVDYYMKQVDEKANRLAEFAVQAGEIEVKKQ